MCRGFAGIIRGLGRRIGLGLRCRLVSRVIVVSCGFLFISGFQQKYSNDIFITILIILFTYLFLYRRLCLIFHSLN
jgi:hypothetical protein